MSEDLGEARLRLTTDETGLDKGFDSSEAKSRSFLARVQQSTGAVYKTVAAGAATALGAMTVQGTRLNQVLSDLQAETGATGDEWAAMEAVVRRENGRTTASMDEIGAATKAMKQDLNLSGADIGKYADRFFDAALVTKKSGEAIVKTTDDIADGFGVNVDRALGSIDQLIASQEKWGGSLQGRVDILPTLAKGLKGLNGTLDDGIALLNVASASGLDYSSVQQAINLAVAKFKVPPSLKEIIGLQDVHKNKVQLANDEVAKLEKTLGEFLVPAQLKAIVATLNGIEDPTKRAAAAEKIYADEVAKFSADPLQRYIDILVAIPDDQARTQRAIELFGAKGGATWAQLTGTIAKAGGSLDSFNVTQAEAGDKATDVARKLDAGPIRSLKLLGESLGGFLADAGSNPLITGIASFGTILGGFAPNLVGKLTTGLLNGLKGLGLKVAAKLGFEFASSAVVGVATATGEAIGSMTTKAIEQRLAGGALSKAMADGLIGITSPGREAAMAAGTGGSRIGRIFTGAMAKVMAVGDAISGALGGVWRKVAGSAVVTGAVKLASDRAATVYLRALMAGDAVSGAVRSAWGKVAGSAVVTGAITAASSGAATLYLKALYAADFLSGAIKSAWAKIAGTAAVTALIEGAGSKAATAYLKVLIAGDALSGAISGAWARVAGSAAASQAVEKLALAQGASYVGALSGFLSRIVLPIAVVLTLGPQGIEDLRAASDDIDRKFHDALRKNFAERHPGVPVPVDLQPVVTVSNADVARAGLGILEFVNGLPAKIGAALAAGKPVIAKAAGDALGAIGDVGPSAEARTKWAATAREMANRGGAAVATGINDARSAVESAWQALIGGLGSEMTPAQEGARLNGELVSKELARGLASGDPAVSAQARATKQAILDRLAELPPEARTVTKTAMGAITVEVRRGAAAVSKAFADGITAKRDEVQTAWTDMLEGLKHPMSVTKETARLMGQLTSSELQKGLKSGDPAIRAQARYTKDLILARLEELRPRAGTLSKAAMDELRKGMKSKDPEIRAASTAIFNAATSKLKGLPGAGSTAGKGAGAGVASGLNSKYNVVATAAGRLADAVIDALYRLAHIGGGQARATGGSVRAGQVYTVGEHGPETFVSDTPGTIVPYVIPGLGDYVEGMSSTLASLARARSAASPKVARAAGPPGEPECADGLRAACDAIGAVAKEIAPAVSGVTSAIARSKAALRATVDRVAGDLGGYRLPSLTGAMGLRARGSLAYSGGAEPPWMRLATQDAAERSVDSHDTYSYTAIVEGRVKDDPFAIARQLGRVVRGHPPAAKEVPA